MAPVKNGRVVFKEYPGKAFVVPGKTVVYDESETIDVDTVPLDGGVLLKMLYLSIDPYLRRLMLPTEERKAHSGVPPVRIANWAVGVVVRSEDPSHNAGDHVLGLLPLRHYSVVKNTAALMKLENKEGIPWSAYLGVCGMPGKTAYCAWKEFAKPKPGDTVFVSAASGAVGAVVVQLAKADGCRVIASAGTHEKVAYVASLGADVAFNYKLVPTMKVLQREGPINIYWDNVGGETLEAALEQAATHARVIVCGSISTYNTAEPYNVKNLQLLLWKEIHMYGFLVGTLEPKYQEAFYREMPAKYAKGEVKYKEHFVRGLEKGPEAIVEVHEGKNFGKSVLVVAEE
ncbi:NAD(P)-binding protein [Epithele typhae]|uniref:NAD(P)-binding protein n=1 Tax=Epithele typhae TaxID=378194 RepID=UPI002008D1EC|nr:NAD(P)-binding protein [Epithele typhae]KAH9918913.1 NAD(P)-binding protein [Epithele typhae]